MSNKETCPKLTMSDFPSVLMLDVCVGDTFICPGNSSQ